MRLRSFRLRLALLSAGSAAIGLFVFGWAASGLWWKERIGQLDRDLETVGYMLASRNLPDDGWEAFFRSLQGVLGEEKFESRFLLVSRLNHGVVYQTTNWPENLSSDAYAASEEVFDWVDGPPPPAGPSGRPKRRPTLRELGDLSDEERRRWRRDGIARRLGIKGGVRKLQRAQFYTAADVGSRFRIGAFGNRRYHLLLGADLANIEQEQRALQMTLATASIGALALIVAGAWLLSRKALSPIAALTDATRRVSASDLSQRLALPNADREFVPLIDVYNGMMERLERSFHQATRFSADASHELKTPVAIMKGTLERALTEAPENSREQRVYTELLEETEHQQAILQSLLLLARADSGQLTLHQERFSFSALATDAADDAEMMAEAWELQIERSITPEVSVEGDRGLLQQVLHNLLTNATKYNRPEGTVSLVLEVDGADAVLRVANTGPGIPIEAQPRLFERFYRVEGSHSNRDEGIGLGLSLSQEIVKAHGGQIRLLRSDGKETVFEVRLPAAPHELK